MCLHPRYKDLSVGFTEMVELCHRQLLQPPSSNAVNRNVTTLKNLFKSKIRALMMSVAQQSTGLSSNDDVDSDGESDEDQDVPQDPETRIRQEIEDQISAHFQQFSEEFDRR